MQKHQNQKLSDIKEDNSSISNIDATPNRLVEREDSKHELNNNEEHKKDESQIEL
jgi:hypothetical protein